MCVQKMLKAFDCRVVEIVSVVVVGKMGCFSLYSLDIISFPVLTFVTQSTKVLGKSIMNVLMI